MDKPINTNQEELLALYQENRKQIENIVKQLEDLAKKIDDLIPKDYNGRTRFILEDRVKIVTQLYDSILRYRSELSKLLDKEIQLVREIYNLSDDNIIEEISYLPTEKAEEILKKIENIVEGKLSKI